MLERNARGAATRAGAIAQEFGKDFAPQSEGPRRAGPGRSPGGLEGAIVAKTTRTPTGVRSRTTYDPRLAFYGGFVEAGARDVEGAFYLRRAELYAADSAERVLEDGADDAAEDLRRQL